MLWSTNLLPAGTNTTDNLIAQQARYARPLGSRLSAASGGILLR